MYFFSNITICHSIGLLPLKEALLCVPPTVSIDKLTKSLPNSGDHISDGVFLWDDFLENVDMYKFTDDGKRYQRLKFVKTDSGVGEMSAQAVFEFNICIVLNRLLPGYVFLRKNTKTLVIRILLVMIRTIFCSCQ